MHKRVRDRQEPGFPSAGSIEEDFVLEQDGDVSNFLKEKNKVTGEYVTDTFLSGPQYDDNGNIIPYTVIGPMKIFESKKIPEWESFESKLPQTEKKSSNKFASLTKKVYNLDPETELKEKLRRIEEGSKKEQEIQQERLKKMGFGEKIIQERQQKILDAFKATEYK